MKKSSKQTLKNSLLALVALAALGGLLFAAVKYAPEGPFGDNPFLQDVSEKYRY